MNIPVTYNNLALQQSPYSSGQNQSFNQGRPAADDSRRQTQAQSGSTTSSYVFRGELLDSVDNDKQNKPQLNQNIAPGNRQAIETYNAGGTVSPDREPLGRLLDQYV